MESVYGGTANNRQSSLCQLLPVTRAVARGMERNDYSSNGLTQ